MTLTEQERNKFATYLEQEANTNKQLVEQMEKLPNAIPAMTRVLKQDAMAYAYVAAKLWAVEDQTIDDSK